jgi:hypothetical protein
MVPSAWRTLNPTTLAGAAYLMRKTLRYDRQSEPPRSDLDKQSEPPRGSWCGTARVDGFEPDYKLLDKLTVEEAEANPIRIRETGELKPFGYMSGQWESLKRAMRPGDELYRFTSSPESWKHLAGRAGIALVRDGEIVDTLVTMMN